MPGGSKLRKRGVALAAAGALALVTLPPAGGGAHAPETAYVSVAVATLWTRPNAPRALDAPALGNPVDLRAWSSSLDTAARRGLVGRIETQALLGEPVRVLDRRGGWARVVVPDQLTPRDRRGYPGWVPARQLMASRAFGNALAGTVAVVVRPTARLRRPAGAVEVSYGTRLPLRRTAGADVVVSTPDGRTARLVRSAVAVRRRGAPPSAGGTAVVAGARRFVGVRYLWGGTAAFGLDCSGLIQLVYRTLGRTIPRDADAQAAAGTSVARAALRPGDLVFYGRSHVHHVALYVGGERMLEAPNSASSVRIVPLRLDDYAGARRYS